jgi:hypothetical protein
MRHTFSAEFLKILPPATNFGEAWENLCLCLLQADTSDHSIMKLGPPDRGIDIYRQSIPAAYQCKSSERGTFGTIDAQDCIASLATAIAAQKSIPWVHYSVALNAPLSGAGLSKIYEFAASKALSKASLSILSPEYWSKLCERHTEAIKHLFDYRVFVTEAEVVEALKIKQARTAPVDVVVSSNRLPVQLVIPFSGELTVGQLLQVVTLQLGLSSDRTYFSDLGTSITPSFLMMVGYARQPLTLKLSELTAEQRASLQLWILLSWRDDFQKIEGRYDKNIMHVHESMPDINRPETETELGSETLHRMQSIIEEKMWWSLSKRAASRSG